MLPAALKGRVVIIQGIAVKQFAAEDGRKKTVNSLQRKNLGTLGFEVSGLMVYQ